MSHPRHHAEPAQREPDPEIALKEMALRELLIEKGVFTAADIRRAMEAMEARGPALGGRIVARAWGETVLQAPVADPCQRGGRRIRRRHGPRRIDGGGEHAGAAQRHRLHPVLLLPPGAARNSAELVQVQGLPVARSQGAESGTRRVRHPPAWRCRRPRSRQHRRSPLHGSATAPGRYRRLGRGDNGGPGHARQPGGRDGGFVCSSRAARWPIHGASIRLRSLGLQTRSPRCRQWTKKRLRPEDRTRTPKPASLRSRVSYAVMRRLGAPTRLCRAFSGIGPKFLMVDFGLWNFDRRDPSRML